MTSNSTLNTPNGRNSPVHSSNVSVNVTVPESVTENVLASIQNKVLNTRLDHGLNGDDELSQKVTLIYLFVHNKN